MQNPQVLTITEGLWEEVKSGMCDEYCKHPFNTETQAELNEICRECPLNKVDDAMGYNPWQE